MLRVVVRLLGGLIALLLALSVGLHFLAGPAGVPDGWRPAPAPPTPLSTQTGSFHLEVSPVEALIDQPIGIEISGLVPGEDLLLRATTLDADDVEFQSWARFRADTEGKVKPGRTAPLEGSYSGIDGSGLLWSMGAAGDPPFYTSRSWSRREVRISAETSAGVREVLLARRYPWNDLHFEEVDTDGVRGEFWAPEVDTKLPAIITLGGFGDGPSPVGSSLLAERGFAVLNLGYHAWPGLPSDLVEVPVETVSRAVDWLENHEDVDPKRVGVMGVSKGAELALLAASHEPRLRAVAAWAPSSVAFVGISFRSPRPGSSWTRSGTAVKYADSSFDLRTARNAARLMLRRPVSFGSTYERALESAIEAGADDVFLPVERITGPVLLAAGGEDLMWPSARMTEEIVARLERNAFPHRIVTVVDRGAGHHLNYSLWPSGGGPSRDFIRGGTPEASHRAGQRAWRDTLAFFSEKLAGQEAPVGKPRDP